MKKAIVLGPIMLLLFASPLLMANGLNLNGLGARAVSMGGAFVGLADDYSAVFWNPAGIANFDKKTLGFSGDLIMPTATYELTVGGYTFIDAKAKSKMYPSGIAAYYHPLTEKLVVGIGVYTPSGIGAEWNGSDFFVSALSPLQSQAYNNKSFLGIVTISPVVAYKVSNVISVGASLNINYGSFNLSRWAGGTILEFPGPPYAVSVDFGQYDEESTGWGFGGTFGVLVDPCDMFSLGLTFRTPTKVSMSGTASISNFSALGYPGESKFDRNVTFPMWLAGGIAFHPTENLTLTLDAQYTNWAELDQLETEFTDSIWKVALEGSAADVMELEWDDCVQIRFGAEYILNKLAFRAGYYYDPAPAPDKTMNVLIPNYDFNGITFGMGYRLNGLHVDAVLEYLMAKERNVDVNDPENAQPGIYNMNLIAPGISVSYRW